MTDDRAELVLPPLWYRILTAVVIAFIIVVVVAFGIGERQSFGAASIVITVLAILYLIRSLRAGIVLHPDRLVVRGFLASRQIPRSAITAVDRFPFIDWNDRNGVSHQTVVAVFSGGSNGGGGAAGRAAAKGRLESWFGSAAASERR